MTIANVQAPAKTARATTTYTTASYGSNVSAGSLLVAIWIGNAVVSITSVTDTLGNTWAAVGTMATSGSNAIQIWAAQCPSGGANTVTFNHGAATSTNVTLFELSGCATSSAIDGSGLVTNGNGPDPSGTLTTTVGGSCIIGAVSDGGGLASIGAGYTNGPTGDYAALYETIQYNLAAGATGTKTFNYTAPAGTWCMAAAAFKIAGGGGAAPFVTSLTPSSGYRNATTSLSIVGTDLTGGVVTFSGTGVTAANTVVNSPTSISVDAVVTAGAAATARTVTVTTANGADATRTFSVLAAASVRSSILGGLVG